MTTSTMAPASPPTATNTTGRTRPARGGGRQPSEQAIDAAIDSATRLLRLPTFRDRYVEIADVAGREQLSYRAFLSELLLAVSNDAAAAGWFRPCSSSDVACRDEQSGRAFRPRSGWRRASAVLSSAVRMAGA